MHPSSSAAFKVDHGSLLTGDCIHIVVTACHCSSLISECIHHQVLHSEWTIDHCSLVTDPISSAAFRVDHGSLLTGDCIHIVVTACHCSFSTGHFSISNSIANCAWWQQFNVIDRSCTAYYRILVYGYFLIIYQLVWRGNFSKYSK